MTDSGSGQTDEPTTGRVVNAELLRRQLRIALRNARLDAGLTQGTIAERLGWSISKVVRIEQGTVPVAPSDVMALLLTYGEKKQEIIDQLVDVAHKSRDARSWTSYEDLLSMAFRELIGQEQSASTIWKYESAAVPGYFQTSSYTRELLWALGYREGDLERRIEVRAKRQQILELDPPPEMNIVIGEVALVRAAGDGDVMREQLIHLRELATRREFNFYLLPFSAGPHRGMGVPFTVLQFSDLDLDDSLYLEDADKRTTSHDNPEALADHLRLFNELRRLAEPHGSFEDQLDRILDEWYGS